IIYNFCKMNKAAIEKGKTEPPFAFVIPKAQHDPITALKMVEVLMMGGVEVHQANKEFFAGNIKIEEGSYVILLSQPFRPYVKDLLERQSYPDLRNYPGGPPIRPYDMTGWTLPLMMGVETLQIDSPFEADLSQIKTVRLPKGYLTNNKHGNYLISHQCNRSFIAVNRLLSQGKKVYWLKNESKFDTKTYPSGTIYIPKKEMNPNKMTFLAQELSLEIEQTNHDFEGQLAYSLKKFKLGLYQPWTANMDEGWTRLVLEQFEFPYETILNSKIRKGNLEGGFDVIILPDMKTEQIISGRKKEKPDIYRPEVPKVYQDGITEEGVEHLKEFVEKGGTLITLDSACDLAIEKFGLPVENVLKEVKNTDFFCPGSLLEIVVDHSEPIAYGMPSKAAAMFINSPAFRPIHWKRRTGVAAYYPDYSPLLSGWILGEEKIQGRSAVLDIPMGEGRVILIGFRAQNRAQTHGTYKFLFNAIQLSRAEEIVLEK
ncbi:MAG: hypothetical protein ACE5IW_13480, partial [bacterium]